MRFCEFGGALLLSLSTILSINGQEAILPETRSEIENQEPIPEMVVPAPRSDTFFREANEYYVVLEPRDRVIISSQVPTPVLKVYKLLGESFEKGEPLLLLDDTIQKAAVTRSEAMVEKGKAVLSAKQNLFNDQIASYVELKEAEALLAGAQSELAVAKHQYEACHIMAPYKGRVVANTLLENEFAQIGQPLIEIVGDSVFVAKILVDSIILDKIHIGQKLKIKIRETNQEIEAVIVRIGAAIDPASSTIKIDAEIDNRDLGLISGMTGVTTIP